MCVACSTFLSLHPLPLFGGFLLHLLRLPEVTVFLSTCATGGMLRMSMTSLALGRALGSQSFHGYCTNMSSE